MIRNLKCPGKSELYGCVFAAPVSIDIDWGIIIWKSRRQRSTRCILCLLRVLQLRRGEVRDVVWKTVMWPVIIPLGIDQNELATHPHKTLHMDVYTAVPPYLWGACSTTPRGCLKLQREPNATYTMFFPIHTCLWWSLIYKFGTVRD